MEHCHVVYPTEPSVVHISHWIDKNIVRDYFFVSSKLSLNIQNALQQLQDKKEFQRNILVSTFTEKIVLLFEKSKNPVFIYQSIFTDDSITNVVSKICIFINKERTERFPYIWKDSTPLRFKNMSSWKDYHVNPFMVSSLPSEPNQVEYLGNSLLLYESFNIILYEDFINKYTNPVLESFYFPNEKDILGLNKNTIKGYLNEHAILSKLWYQNPKNHRDIIEKSVCILNRVRINTFLPTKDSLKAIFNKLHTSEFIPFIQFVNDLNHVYYKVYKDHRIPEAYFDTWTQIDQMNGQSQIILYSFIQEKSILYADIRIDNQNKIYISYRLDFSENITFERINKHIDNIFSYFEKYLNVKDLEVEIENLSLRTTVQIQQANLKSISKYFSSLLPLFNVPTKNRIQSNILDLQFKRIPKYGQTKNIREYIKNKLALDIPILDILIDLQEYGLDEAEVRDYLEEIQQEQDKIGIDRKKKDIRNIGLLMHLSVVSFGVQINIDNASSFFDITNALAWTRSALLAWRQETRFTEKPTKGVIIKEIEEEEEEEEKPIIPVKPQSSEKKELGESDVESILSFGSEDQMGGAIGKEYNRYFNTLLKQVDPNIFALTDNYARKCQVVDLRQPVAISKEQKIIIDNSIYKDSYDNFIEYGSDPTKTNIYMCPRVWCPKSQVPLSPAQYDDGKGKCPRDDEEPMLLYKHATWYNDVQRPHYVGYLKEKGFNNVQLPCCFKRPQDTTQKQVSVKDKEEYGYIIDKVKNIPEARFGTIPQSLHEFLYPNAPYKLCKNTVKTNECLLRRGIATHKDTFLTSIAYLMNFESKVELIRFIIKELTPLVFITLENGLVYQTFQSQSPLLIEKEYALRKQLYKWIIQHNTYRKQFQLDDLLPLLLQDNIEDLPMPTRFRMARQLSIMDAYQRFIEYLREDNEKNPHMFFDLFHHLGFVTIVWNRDSNTLATMKCPYAYKLKNWLIGSNKLLPCIILMRTDNSYEPMVIVDPSKNIQQRIFFSKYPKLEQLLLQCPTFKTNDNTIIHSLYKLHIWTLNILSNPSKFIIQTILLDYNYRIMGFLTKGHIWIELPNPLSISSIPYILDSLPIENILYAEDIQSKLFDIKVIRMEYTLWAAKLKRLGFGNQIGEIKKVTDIWMETIFKIPRVIYPDIPKVPLILSEPFMQNLETIEYDNHQWFKVKKYILYTLLQEYDTFVKPILSMPKKQQLEKLYIRFTHLQQPARTAVLLEELPYSSKETIETLYQDLLLEKPYYHYPDKIYEGYRKKEWIFTQHMVTDSKIAFVKHPSIIHNTSLLPIDSQETLQKAVITELQLPSMINEKLTTSIGFPTKWRAVVWRDYQILLLNSYQQSSVFEYIEWILHQEYLDWNQEDLQLYLKKQYLDLLEDKANYSKLFEDPSMRIAWNNVLHRNYRNSTELIEIGLASLTTKEIQQKWLDVLSTQSSSLWIQDFDLYNISRLFKISFFIINKGKTADKKNEEILSSVKFINSFEGSWKYRPVILLYKQIAEDKTHSIYGVIIKDKKYYYRQGSELPEEIVELIQEFKQM